jgi:DNA-binding NarL/FixJ family response regulator
LKGSAILIVDPEAHVRKFVSEALGREGYPTLQAASGEEALELAQSERPRLVVLEVCLPGICGYQVCRELREAFGDGLSIIFVSGIRTEPFDRVGGLLLGADDYLVKPFAADELLARVGGLIRRSAPLTSEIASTLTRREQDVLQLLAQGLDQKEIANRLCISPRTVGTHTEHIFVKLGVRNRGQAVALAYQQDFVDRRPPRSFAIATLLLSGDESLLDWLSAFGAVPLPL